MAGAAATVTLVAPAGTRVTVAAADEELWVSRGFSRPPKPPRRAAKRTDTD